MVAPPLVLNTRLSDLGPAWLQLCCCKGTTYLPVRMLAGADPPKTTLRDVLPRLRCQVCHDRPATLALIEDPAGQANGGPPVGWVISLDWVSSEPMWRGACPPTLPRLVAGLIPRGELKPSATAKAPPSPGGAFSWQPPSRWSRTRAGRRSAPPSTTAANDVTFGFWPPKADRRTVPRRPDCRPPRRSRIGSGRADLNLRPGPTEIPPRSGSARCEWGARSRSS